MGNLVATPQWVDVPYFEANAVLTGGPDCPDNIPIQALLDRTEYLKGSPEFSGAPKAPTAPVGTNTPQLATTAFVQAAQSAGLGSTSPLMDGTAAAGTATKSAREDHRHPTDTTRAPLSSPAFTGTPTAPTAPAGSSSTQIATTAFVKQIAEAIVTVAPGTVFFVAGSSAPAKSLKANGAAVSRSVYAALFSAIGTTYGDGNGSTTFNLPDLRGEFIRCFDDDRGVDAGRQLGSTQDDGMRSHRHLNGYADEAYALGDSSHVYGETKEDMPGLAEGRAMTGNSGITNAVQGYTSYTGGSETKPRNIALLACIGY